MTDNKRTAIPKRVRFEVFKRDSFTCQYCGAKAPGVILQCDHIHPVAGGGGNDILNLLTSCRDCNGGKGAIPLADTAAIDRQREMLEDLEERRQQIEMMMLWRDELRGLSQDAVSMVAQRIGERTGIFPNESGKNDIRKLIQKHGVEAVMSGADASFDTYLEYQQDAATYASWGKAFSKIGAVIAMAAQGQEKPYLLRLFYIQGILRNRTRARRYEWVAYLEHAHLAGVDLDWMERFAKRIHSIEEFEAPIDRYLAEQGKPY